MDRQTEIYSLLHRHHTKEIIRMGSKTMKRYSTALVATEMQIQAMMRHHYLPPSMEKIKTNTVLKPDYTTD